MPDDDRGELVARVRDAIYDTDLDRNPRWGGGGWGNEPQYRRDDYTAMAEAAVDAMMAVDDFDAFSGGR